MQKPKRIGELRTQVDRFPLSDKANTQYLLSIVCVGVYTSQPDAQAIVRALLDACGDVEATEGVANAEPYQHK